MYDPCKQCSEEPYRNANCTRKCAYANSLEKVEKLERLTRKQAEAIGGAPVEARDAMTSAISDFQELLCDDYHEVGIVSVSLAISALRQKRQQEIPLTIEQLKAMVPERNAWDDSQRESRKWVWIKVMGTEGVWQKLLNTAAYYRVACDYSDGKKFCCGYPGHLYEFDYSTYGASWEAYSVCPAQQ